MRREKLYVLDIVEACQKIEKYLDKRAFGDLVNDNQLFDAIVRNLQIIDEAVRCLPDEVRDLKPDIEWSRIVGLRHLLVHQYFGIDPEIVWDLAKNRCPELLEASNGILDALDSK